MLAITCLKAQDIQVEVSHKYPRLVGLANSFVYLYGGMVPVFDLQYQQNRINDGSFYMFGLGGFSVPNKNEHSVSLEYMLDYKNISSDSQRTRWNSFALYLGPRFYSDKRFLKYSFSAKFGGELVYVSDEVALKPDVSLGLSFGFPLANSRIMFEAAYHPIKKVIGDNILKSYYSLNVLWLIFLPEREVWTTNY